MTRLGTWSWSIENPNCVCAPLFVQTLWTVVPAIRNSCAQSFTCFSSLIICALLLWTLLRLLCTIIGTFSVLNYSHHASSMHFDKLIYLQVGILQASPIYNENLYSLSLHTCFHFFCEQCKCLSCAHGSGQEWWSRPGASPTIEQPNSESNALVSAGLTSDHCIDGRSSCFL